MHPAVAQIPVQETAADVVGVRQVVVGCRKHSKLLAWLVRARLRLTARPIGRGAKACACDSCRQSHDGRKEFTTRGTPEFAWCISHNHLLLGTIAVLLG